LKETTVSALLWALPALLALAGVYRVSPTSRHTVRIAAAITLWATCICLIITWS
jgi:hypothetical protein